MSDGMQNAALVSIVPTKIWIECGLMGERFVVLQHEGCEPFDYAVFNYDHRYTSNGGTLAAAESLALALGAQLPIEHKHRSPQSLNVEDLEFAIKELSEMLAELKPGREVESHSIALGPELFSFATHQTWVNKAQSWYKNCGLRSEDTIAIDSKGRICSNGKDMISARVDNAFPVRVFAKRN